MDWHARVRRAFETSPTVPDASVIEELAQHARSTYEAALDDGCPAAEAERRVNVQLDEWRREAALLRRRPRRTPAVPPPGTSASPWSAVSQDMHYALRLLRRQPRFALLVVLTMALGIAGTTVLFSVAHGVLMKPLPWPNADRVVVVSETRGGNAPRFMSFTNAAYLAWQEEASTIEELAAWSERVATLTGAGDADRVRIVAATPGLFRVLGVRPLIGSLLADTDEDVPAVILSERLWRQRFGADEALLGRPVHLDGGAYTVIGVLPERFAFPTREVQAWVPFRVRPPTGNYLSMFHAVARLRDGSTPLQAAAEGTARGRFVADTGLTTTAIFGGDGPVEVTATPLREALTGDVRRPLLVLLAAVMVLLLIATTNVASLQVARATTRRRELAIRAALGASGTRVMRQLVVESLMLGLAGGLVGLSLAWMLHRVIPSIMPADFPRMADVALDEAVVWFAVGVTLLTSIAFGLLPALRVCRQNLVGSLAEDGASPVAIGRGSPVARMRLLIVGSQVAMACVLLVVAVLLGRSFVGMLNADRGFDPARVLSARLALPDHAFSAGQRAELLRSIVERLAAIPAVHAAAFTSDHPLAPGGSTSAFVLRSNDAPGGTIAAQASPRVVSPGFFAALGVSLIAGRPLLDSDTAASPRVAVVNEAFARAYLGVGPIGRRIPGNFWNLEEDAEATIVGVVEDIKYIGAASTSMPEMYFSQRQLEGKMAPSSATLLVRTEGDPAAFAGILRSTVQQVDPALVPEAVMTLEDRLLSTSLARPRLYAMLVAGFAGTALLVTAVGLFAVLSYTVAQRTRELGLRAALGASGSTLVWIVLGDGARVVAGGMAVGLVTAGMLAEYLRSLLYGITPEDISTYGAVAVIVFGVALVACLGPAVRAGRLDPLVALRSG